MKKYKITLRLFWMGLEKSVIHCDTREKAKKLLMAFDRLGKRWSSGKSYTEESNYNNYLSSTCYSNTNTYSYYNWYKEHDYTIYEFEDVDLDN